MQENRSNNENVCKLVLLMKTSLIEEYQLVFPNGQNVKLSICKISGQSVEVGDYVVQGKNVIVQKVKNIQQFLEYFAVKKRMSIIRVGLQNIEKILSQYDLIVCQSDQTYCIYFQQPSQSIYSYIRRQKIQHNLLKIRLQRGYNAILSDIRSHHILLGKQWDFTNLRMTCKPDRLLLKLPRSYRIVDQGYDYYQFSMEKDGRNNPYFQDIEKMNEVLSRILSKSNEQGQQQKSNIIAKNNNIQLLLNYSDFIFKIDRQNFITVSSNPLYSHFFKDRTFLIKLYQHFKQTCKINNLQPLMDLWKQLFLSQMKKQNAFVDEKRLQNKLQIDPFLRNYGNIGISQSTPLYDIVKKTYYNPLKLKIRQRMQGIIVGSKDINGKIEKIQTSLKKGKCMFHFLRAKQALCSNLLFRALSHYKKALIYAKNQQKSIILCEIGSILTNLNEYSEAQLNFKESIKIRTNQWGKYHIKMLVPLQNLINLYLRKHQQFQAQRLYEYSQQIKKIYNYNSNFRLFPNLIPIFYSQTIFANHYLIDKNKSKSIKTIGKKQISKFMVQKYPFLQNIYSSLKNIVQFIDNQQKQQKKIQKKKDKLQISKTQSKLNQIFQYLKKSMEFGQLNNIFYMLKILSCLGNQSKLSQIQLQSISHQINHSKTNNRKDYNRFIFLMSFYYQKFNDGQKAIQYIQLLTQNSTFSTFQIDEKQSSSPQGPKTFTQRESIQRRYLQLCKKFKFDDKLLSIYETIGWLQQKQNTQLLYDAIFFLKDRKKHLLCIRASRIYLTIYQQQRNPKNKEIVMILAKELLDFQLVQEAWKEINKVFMHYFDDSFKRKVYHFIGEICVFANKDREYQLCIKVFQYLKASNQMMKMDIEILEQIWIAVVNSLVEMNQQCNDTQMFDFYKMINIVQLDGEILRKIEEISYVKKCWKYLLNHLLEQKNNHTSLIKEISFDQLISHKLFFKVNIKTTLKMGNFDNYLNANNTNGSSNFKLNQYSSTIVELALEYGKKNGYNSLQFINLQCFLFLALQEKKIFQKILLHLWFISLPRQISQKQELLIFGGRSQRQKIFDELLLYYFNNKCDSDMSESILYRLIWYNKKIKQLQRFYSAFHRLNKTQTNLGDIEQFSILYSSYFSIDESQSLLLKYSKSKQSILMLDHIDQ